MDYKLVKQLKDAGFHQPAKNKEICKGYYLYDLSKKPKETAYVPTAEELINACNQRGFFLMKKSNCAWIASILDSSNRATGKTFAEAITKLWLKLQKQTKIKK